MFPPDPRASQARIPHRRAAAGANTGRRGEFAERACRAHAFWRSALARCARWRPVAALRARIVRGALVGAVMAGCAVSNPPLNTPLAGDANALPDIAARGGGTAPGDIWIGLAFSGGGMRASAFAHGMTKALRAQGPGPNGLLDHVRLVSGVSGGSVTAAQLGLNGPEGLRGYRERYLMSNAERYMATSALNPVTLVRGIAGGANGRATFGRHLDEVLFRGATFGDLHRRGRIETWINATDIAGATPFIFVPETFDALCSDLSRLPLSEAVAASAAFPLVFAPVVLRAHQGACDYTEPDWLTTARFNPEASAAMRAYGRALEGYADPARVRYVKLLDGGVTDNFGTTGLAIARARAQAPYAPMRAEDAVRLRRMLFLVADAGAEAERDWSDRPTGPGGVGLAMAIAGASVSSATRAAYDSMRAEMRRWEAELIDWRCGLPRAEVARLRGSLAGWDCRDLRIFVGVADAHALPPAMRADFAAVPTRLRLPPEQVDLAIEAGRRATLAAPEFNGFLAAIGAASIDARIAETRARGGRQIVPVSQ